MEGRMIYALDLFGTGVFAVTGALAAVRKRMDIFGVTVVAMVTAIGGGTLRDLVLGRVPVFWVHDPWYIVVILTAAVGTFAWAWVMRHYTAQLLVADALGLAVFTVIGSQVALEAQGSALVAMMMGVMTGAVGGILRDVLCNEVPLILRKEIYATASLAGAIIYVAGARLKMDPEVVVPVAIAVVFLTRLAAIKWRLSLPVAREESGDKGA
jgi:uncharacterized membrane protein YeiH